MKAPLQQAFITESNNLKNDTMPKNLYIVTFLILALCAACDNPYSPDSDDGGTGTTTGTTKKDCNVTLRVANLEQVDYNEASNNEASNN